MRLEFAFAGSGFWFFIVLAKLFCALIHGIPDRVWDDGEEFVLRQAQDDEVGI